MTGARPSLPAPSPLAAAWSLDPSVAYLNHGSYGAAPRTVLARQAELRARLEQEPERFFVRDLEALSDEVRRALGRFLGARPDDLAPVANATAGVNAVLRSLDFGPGDELLTTSHAYNACANALRYVAGRTGAQVVRAEVPFPSSGPEQAAAVVLAQVSGRTRLVLLDHVTSPTGIMLPVERLVREIQGRGIDVLVDGAHAPGMVPLDLEALGAAYYTGNCHKWLCAPKAAAFLYVRPDRQERIHPLVISHGANSQRTDRSRFRLEFDWGGTVDPTAWLCVPAAIEAVGSLVPGGWPEVRARNHALAVEARRALCAALDVAPPCPEEMLGSLAAVRLPDGDGRRRSPPGLDPIQDALLERFGIEVPINSWPAPPRRWVRVSAQLYNSVEQYAYLGESLRTLLGEESGARG